jgi:hypothetical protein
MPVIFGNVQIDRPEMMGNSWKFRPPIWEDEISTQYLMLLICQKMDYDYCEYDENENDESELLLKI